MNGEKIMLQKRLQELLDWSREEKRKRSRFFKIERTFNRPKDAARRVV